MNLMIDLETLGLSTKAPIISIGACFFNQSGIKEKFYAILDIEEQIDSGKRKVDASTIKWWMQQEKAAQKIFSDDIGVKSITTVNDTLHFIGSTVEPLYHNKNKQILYEFCIFCNNHGGNASKPWGNGSIFDITILESVFSDYELTPPWKFFNVRDLRTFKEYVYDGADMKFKGTAHNALDDAIHQAEVVIE